ncbi:MAG: coproporphyrinogen dehydrogenase HemZ [Lachnospiraceae bacterium]|nr:coproporphyrinogen dehydrogenase HemZ [Lachnospiraceae bacterium]
MLMIKSNMPGFEYDIHSLVKAFYGEKTVKVVSMEVCRQEADKMSIEPFLCVELFLDEGKVECTFFPDENHVEAEKFLWEFEIDLLKEKKTFKNEFKKFFYQYLCRITGKELPWGNLTGIRPTKIAMGMIEEGMEENKILAFLETEHFVSREKAELSLDIAKREQKLLSSIHYEDGYSLYIGIPFCPTTCLYCSFTSYPICSFREKVEKYIDCLVEEMDFVAKAYKGKVLDTVYIGGGTPTTLEATQLDRLICALKDRFSFEQVKEFTVEAGRADSITKEKLEVLFSHGVTRISVNPQTMKEETLRLIGRRHTVEQVKEAFGLAREVGFTNINMDLILGLPEETKEDVERTISEIRKLAPDSLTIHSLAIKRASKLNEWVEKNGISMLKNTDETMEIAARGAKELSMKPYYLYRQKNMAGNFENVGYAREGCFGIYNILIMEEKQTIVALGAGSITKRVYPDGRIERCDNVKDVSQYMERIEEMIERKRELLKES